MFMPIFTKNEPFRVKCALLASCALFLASGAFFQSCSQVENVQPMHKSNTVTIKVRDQGPGQSKHLHVAAEGQVVLDTDISGDYTYSFPTNMMSITVTASLTSSATFISSLEIDANHSMEAYHAGSCDGRQYEISKLITF
jgi:hypothetical protein